MDFKTMTGPQLVTAFNEMVLTAIDLGLPAKTVKRFGDQQSGCARCAKLHAQIQEKKSAPAATEEGIPAFLKRKDDRVVIPSKPTLAPVTRPALTVDKTARDWRIPKGMSDEEGAAMLARQQEEKKQKAAERIKTMQEKKAERDAEKLAAINVKRKAQGLELLTSLTKIIKQKPETKETNVMRKAKKTAKAKSKSANGAWMSNDAVITKLDAGKEYDPRKGTTASKLWDAIRTGMTVGAYKEKGKAPAMAYLRWFIAHNYVKVSA